PYPRFNFDQTGTRIEHKAGGRFDFQFSPKMRLALRGNHWVHNLPYDPRYTRGGDKTPSSAVSLDRGMDQLFTTLTNVIGTRAVNEVKLGYAGFNWNEQSYVKWPNHPAGFGVGAPSIQMRGLTIGETHNQTPQKIGQELYSIRDDYTVSYNRGGRHDLKVGGEFLNDGTWRQNPPRKVYGGWVQDDWSIRKRLTLNLGVRYDLETGVFAEKIEFLPFLQANRPSDTNNFGPRVGFAYSLNDRTVIRGGAGKYFGEISGQPSFWTKRYTEQIHPEILYDGRPDFAVNPFNGPYPTYEQALATTCAVSRTATCVRREIPSQLAASDLQIAYSYQGSLGVQRQIASSASVEADYVTTRARAELYQRSNINLTYNQATGVNYPFTDFSRRPYPDFGLINQFRSDGWS